MNKTNVRQRALALGLGGVLTISALWGGLWVLLIVFSLTVRAIV